jgi:hypothetical protein
LTGVNHAYGFNGGMQLGLVFFFKRFVVHYFFLIKLAGPMAGCWADT